MCEDRTAFRRNRRADEAFLAGSKRAERPAGNGEEEKSRQRKINIWKIRKEELGMDCVGRIDLGETY